MTQAASNPPLVFRRPRSLTAQAARRFFRSKMVWAGSAILIVIVAASVFGGIYGVWPVKPQGNSAGAGDETGRVGVSSPRYDQQDLGHAFSPPSGAHPFGTDQLGRDLLVRTLFGGAISLAVGLMAALVSVAIGMTWGALSGYVGGRIDGVMMRIVDVLYGLPYILLVILFTVAFGEAPPGASESAQSLRKFVVLFLAIGAVSWLTMARVVRGQVLSLKNNDYVAAAVAAGASHRRIIFVHLLPNLLGPIIVYATLIVPQAILQESFLSFLGIGVQPPAASWGSLASDGISKLNPVVSTWWLTFFPCLVLALTLLSLNLIGDGLRDAFDPQLRRRK